MSARRVARVVVWPFEEAGKALVLGVVYSWYLILTMLPITHAWMHMWHDRDHPDPGVSPLIHELQTRSTNDQAHHEEE